MMQTEFASKALNSDGSDGYKTRILSVGCDVNIVAEQSLKAISDKVYETYVGDESGAKLWDLTLKDPNQAIEILLAQTKR